jgi:hypothetical protein
MNVCNEYESRMIWLFALMIMMLYRYMNYIGKYVFNKQEKK